MKQEDTKQRILEKALELFSNRGYDAVSVGEIASAVGIKAALLYNHYSGKQAIFDAIVEKSVERYEKFAESMDVHLKNVERDTGVFASIDADTLADKVRAIFLYTLHDETVGRFRRMMSIEQFRSPDLAQLYSERYYDRLVRYHTGIFRALISDGVIGDYDPESLAVMYISAVITLLGVCDRQPEREAECLEKLKNHVVLFYRTYNAEHEEQHN